MGHRTDPGGLGRVGLGGGFEPDEGLAADPGRRHRVQRVSATARVLVAAGQGANGGPAPSGRRLIAATVLILSTLALSPSLVPQSVEAAPVNSTAAVPATAPRAPDVASLRPPIVW